MKRTIILFIALFACGSTPAAASPTPPTYVCTDGADRVVYDGATATYSSAGTLVGSSQCGGTRMAVYNMACVQSAKFDFYFASVPGPAVLSGKSARLDVAGKTTLMSCK